MITLSILQRQVHLNATQRALAGASTSRRAIQLHFQQELRQCLVDYAPFGNLSIHEEVLEHCTRTFSEQAVFDPLGDLGNWFNYSHGRLLGPGYQPLFYSGTNNRRVSPSKSAIAAIGEGVAGFLAQRLYHCRLLARPIQDYPDLVMDRLDSNAIYLVESKASTGTLENLQRTVDEETIRLSSYASACMALNTRPIRGLLIATALQSIDHYQTFLTEILM